MPAYRRFNDDDEEEEGSAAAAASHHAYNAEVASSTEHSAAPEERSAVKIFMSYEDSNELETLENNNNMTEIPQESLTEDARWGVHSEREMV